MSSRTGMGPWLRLKKRSMGVMYAAARSRRAGSALNGSCAAGTPSVPYHSREGGIIKK